MNIEAVAFDVDGTLYPDIRLWKQLGLKFVFKHGATIIALGRARHILRKEIHPLNFKEKQTELAAQFLKIKKDDAVIRIKACYDAWESAFSQIEPFEHLTETLLAIQSLHLKMAVLSDLPPKTKLINMKLDQFFPIQLNAEDSGALKPAPASFTRLCAELDCKPSQILYVGDSEERDVLGAKSFGMMTARIVNPFKLRTALKTSQADILFSDYRVLAEKIMVAKNGLVL